MGTVLEGGWGWGLHVGKWVLLGTQGLRVDTQSAGAGEGDRVALGVHSGEMGETEDSLCREATLDPYD